MQLNVRVLGSINISYYYYITNCKNCSRNVLTYMGGKGVVADN